MRLEYKLTKDDEANINDVGNDIGADCKSCNERQRDWGACHLCPDRPFGSAPCCDSHENPEDDPDCSGCPNAQICVEIAEREWPLAELAINFTESTKGGAR